MFLSLVSIVFSTPLASAPPPSSAMPPPIVVVGQRISDAKARLRECLARNCAPNEDIDATLALAETELLAGEYHDARDTLRESLRRNRRHADSFPIPVSDLYRADGKVSAHLGYDRHYSQSTWQMYRILKNAFSNDDHKVFSARMEVAEMMGRLRGHTRARDYYDSIARDARQAGRPDIAALAELRSYIRHFPPGPERSNGIAAIANSTDPKVRAAALQAKLALARNAFEKHDLATARTLQTELADFDLEKPILIYSPAYETHHQEILRAGDFPIRVPPKSGNRVPQAVMFGQFSGTKRLSPVVEDMWIDVSFRITPEGTVADVQIPRSKGDRFWAQTLLQSIRGRRYTPAKEGSPGSYRLERYTYASGFEGKTGSRLPDHSPQTRIEYLDLTGSGLTAVN